MAIKVTAVALGGEETTHSEINTVAELATKLGLGENHSVKINANTASYDTVLEDYNYVSFGEKVKGGKTTTILRKAGQPFTKLSLLTNLA